MGAGQVDGVDTAVWTIPRSLVSDLIGLRMGVDKPLYQAYTRTPAGRIPLRRGQMGILGDCFE